MTTDDIRRILRSTEEIIDTIKGVGDVEPRNLTVGAKLILNKTHELQYTCKSVLKLREGQMLKDFRTKTYQEALL
jgi:hypothetical protein